MEAHWPSLVPCIQNRPWAGKKIVHSSLYLHSLCVVNNQGYASRYSKYLASLKGPPAVDYLQQEPPQRARDGRKGPLLRYYPLSTIFSGNLDDVSGSARTLLPTARRHQEPPPPRRDGSKGPLLLIASLSLLVGVFYCFVFGVMFKRSNGKKY